MAEVSDGQDGKTIPYNEMLTTLSPEIQWLNDTTFTAFGRLELETGAGMR